MMSFAALLLTVGASASPDAAATVWHWQDCARPGFVRITIDADGARVLEATVPACRIAREDIAHEPKQRIIDFPAAQLATRLAVASPRNLTGNVWQAGADPGGLMLGVSFQTDDRVVLNTLHFADAAKASRSEVAPGIVVATTMLAAPRAAGR